LVSDHTPVDEDAKALPFAEAEPGATGVELLWSLALKWGQEQGVPMSRVLECLTAAPAALLDGAVKTVQGPLGRLAVGGVADVVVLSEAGHWPVKAQALRSQGKNTPFEGYELPGAVRMTLVGGHIAFEAN
jgi:dihydroorotase